MSNASDVLEQSAARFGVWDQYGWRAGKVPSQSLPYAPGPIVGGYGNGFPLAGLFSYVLKPQELVAGSIVTVVNVPENTNGFLPMILPDPSQATLFAQPYWGSQWVPKLLGTETAPLLLQMNNANQALAIQLQYPCLIEVRIANNTRTQTFCIFGYDQYYQPMQQTIATVDDGDGHSIGATTRAFYGVTGVYTPLIDADDIDLTVSPLATFGLPYFCENKASMVSYTETDAFPSDPTDLIAGDTQASEPTNTTDVRGLLEVTTAPDGDITYRVLYHVLGGDMWMDQTSYILNNTSDIYNPFKLEDGISPITPEVVYGVSQYYAGYFTT